MKRKPGIATAAVLICMTLGIWFASSCASSKAPLMPDEKTLSHWDETVDKHIPDPQRAAKLKQLGQQLADLANDIKQDIDALNDKAMTLNENYNATTEEALQLVRRYTKLRNPAFAQYRDIIFAMRSQVSAEEWRALTK